jgi:hypothetical protein
LIAEQAGYVLTVKQNTILLLAGHQLKFGLGG